MPIDKHNVVVMWFRRDLRLTDNHALHQAEQSGMSILPVFIFDNNITRMLPANDARISFIYNALAAMNIQLNLAGSSLLVKQGMPEAVIQELSAEYNIKAVYANKDYEPYALQRDQQVAQMLRGKRIALNLFKDHLIFEPNEILKPDTKPYTVYTPYKKRWLAKFSKSDVHPFDCKGRAFLCSSYRFPSLESLGFSKSATTAKKYNTDGIATYADTRDFPAKDRCHYL